MGLPEPVDPHGLWQWIKDHSIDTLYPPDDEDVAFALAAAYFAAADTAELAGDQVRQAAGQVPAAWPDLNGYQFHIGTSALADEYDALATALRLLGDGVDEYGRLVRETKIGFWVEISINAALFGALAFIPGGAAVAYTLARTIAGRLSSLVVSMTGRVASGGLARAAQAVSTLAVEIVQEGAEEAFINTTTQVISMAEGNRDQFDGRQLGIATGAGALGGALGLGVGRAIAPAAGLVGRGLERVGLSEALAVHGTIAARSTVSNGLTSPVAGHAVENAVNGNWAAVTDVRGYAEAVADGGLAAGLMGSARANTVAFATQVNGWLYGSSPPPPDVPMPGGVPGGAGPVGTPDPATAGDDSGPPVAAPPGQTVPATGAAQPGPTGPPPGEPAPPGQPDQPGRPAQAEQPGQPAQPGQASQPAEATRPGEATEPSEATRPGEATEPGQATQSAGEVGSAQTNPAADASGAGPTGVDVTEAGTNEAETNEAGSSGDGSSRSTTAGAVPSGSVDPATDSPATHTDTEASPGPGATGLGGPAASAPTTVVPSAVDTAPPTGPAATTAPSPGHPLAPATNGPVPPAVAVAATGFAAPAAPAVTGPTTVDPVVPATAAPGPVTPGRGTPGAAPVRRTSAPVAGAAEPVHAPAGGSADQPTRDAPGSATGTGAESTGTGTGSAPVSEAADVGAEAVPTRGEVPPSGSVAGPHLPVAAPVGPAPSGALAAGARVADASPPEQPPAARVSPTHTRLPGPAAALAPSAVAPAPSAEPPSPGVAATDHVDREPVGTPAPPGYVPGRVLDALTPVTGPAGSHDGAPVDPSSEHEGRLAHTGGSIRLRHEEEAWEWAEQEYDRFRADDTDITEIARRLAEVIRPDDRIGFDVAEISQIKQHLMVREHRIASHDGKTVSHRRFDADPEIAAAWNRLRTGRHVDADLVLLEHELAELSYLAAQPTAGYREAHAHANERFNWERLHPRHGGPNQDTSPGQENTDGRTAGLHQGQGGREGDRVPVRISGGHGPPAGDREGIPTGETTGRKEGLGLHGGVREDPANVPERAALAGERDVRGVTETPSNPARFEVFRKALFERVREAARQRGTSPLAELQQFALQRALARIFAANPDDWMLKGGQSLLARLPRARESSDIDLVRISGGDREVMAADYSAALQHDLGDHLSFVPKSRIDLTNVPGVRLTRTVYLGYQELMTLSVDLVPPRSRPLWQAAEVLPFPPHLIETGSTDDRPDLRVISLHDVLAHKVSGMFTLASTGGPPERAQDLVDVLVLALATSWDGPAAHAMLHEEFAWRLAQGEPLQVPGRFEVPNPTWHPTIARYAAATPGLPYMNLGDALPLARAFLDPLLGPTAPHADWDPGTLRWVPRVPGPATPPAPSDAPPATSDNQPDPARVRLIEATGEAPPSTVFADQPLIDRWNTLSGGRHQPDSLDARIEALTARTDLTLPEKIQIVRAQILPAAGVEPSPVTGLDSRNLRFYAHQAGELFIHGAALTLDPDTTIDIGYHLDHTVRAYGREARASQLAFLDAVPAEVTDEQAEAVALWRRHSGRSAIGVDTAELAADLVDIHVQPLRDALAMRRKLIDDYGVAPHRVRVVYGGPHESDTRYGESRWQRAHLLALSRIRDNPVEAREALVATFLGSGAAARIRQARAVAVAERLFARHEPAATRSAPGGGAAYALLWVRDSRATPTANRNGLDTQPAMLRQIIDTVRAHHPGRRIVLVGDDLFARRPELRAAWEHDGVLDGVDAETLVRFWSAGRNDGVPLSPAEQALFFHHLTTGRDIVQIGTESGALEIPFLLGVPTVYLENAVYHLNKGNRWAHIWQEWHYGEFAPLLDEDGNVRFDSSGQPVRAFRGLGDPLPPPLPTVRRVQFGPDLPHPKTRQGPIIMDFPPQTVALTADRIVRLVDDGGLEHWPARLGQTGRVGSETHRAWDARDWQQSRYYADQLHRWLHTEAGTPEAVGQKWTAVRLALTGVLDPGFSTDPEHAGLAEVHPYVLLHSEQGVPEPAATRITEAYAADPDHRPAAVARALRDVLADPRLRARAVAEVEVFRLAPAELRELRRAVTGVVAARAGHPDGSPAPIPAPQPGPPVLDVSGVAAEAGRGRATPPLVVEAAERITAPTTRLVMAAIGLRVGSELRNRIGEPDFYLELTDPADPSAGGRIRAAHEFTAQEVAAAADQLLSTEETGVERLVRQIALRELATTWAGGHHESVRAHAVAEVVRQRFGLATVPEPALGRALGKKVASEREYNEEVFGEALRVQYQLTQRALAEQGVAHRLLYLPVTLDEHPELARAVVGDPVELAAVRPLEQWSSDRETARQRLAAGGGPGVLVEARVAAELLLTTPETALSGPRAGSFVVLGRPLQARIDTLPPAAATGSAEPAPAEAARPAERETLAGPPAHQGAEPGPPADRGTTPRPRSGGQGPRPGGLGRPDAEAVPEHPPYEPRNNLGGTEEWRRQVGELLRAGPDGDYPSWWPRDDSGYAPQVRDLAFLGLKQQQFEWFLRREAPLGMTPDQFRAFRVELLEALRQDEIAPSQVDVRLKGSGARFFSGGHKEMPTEASLADQPQSRDALRQWLGDDPHRPRRIPFDTMHRIGVEPLSDYDLDLSSSTMVEAARRRTPDLVHPDDFLMGHGFLHKKVVEAAFPHLLTFAGTWRQNLGDREVSLGVFESTGSFDRSDFSVVSEHFRPEDWKIHTPGGH